MNNKRKLVDVFLYLIELEKPNTRIIKERPKPKNIETQTKPKVEVNKQLEINPIYRYTIDGDLVDKYLNPKQMAKKLSWRESLLRKAADQETLYKGFLITRTSYAKEQIQQRFVKPKKKPYIQQCKVYQYNKDGELVATYDNSSIASKLTSWNHNTIKEYSRRESYYKGFLLTRAEYTPQQAKERFVAALKVVRIPKPKKEKKPKHKSTNNTKPKVVRIPKPKKEKKPKHKSTNNTKPKVVRIPKPKKEKTPYIQQCKVYQYNKDGELVATYDNSGIASKLTSWNRNTIKEYSKRESYYKGFLLTRTEYTPQQAKERFVAALNNQQVSFVYKGGELVAVCTSLSEVKEVIGLGLTLKQISNSKYYKEPLGDYLITSKPL